MLNTPGEDDHDRDLELDFAGLEPEPDEGEPGRAAAGEPHIVSDGDCVPLDDEREQVGYELFAWEPHELDALDDAVHDLGLAHEWVSDGYELVVHAEDESAVDALLPTIHLDTTAEEDDDADATDIAVLTELFIAVTKLRKDPTGSAVSAFLDAAERIGSAPPYGVDDRTWDRVTGGVDILIDGYHADAPIDVLRNLVQELYRRLRPLV